ncbi:hypothetical protein H5410_052693 [Solanum commersonii]|uniref:Uncharacterized protein n=1 Tax=Solanum commersonii TaxID=4109 RepID=A0A9J5X279_SOLCO|nr:hypothetical protein H5410_052693 [Solanum commersonii]
MIEKSNRYKKLNLNISKGRRMEKTHFQFWKDELLLFVSLPKTLSKLERKYPKKTLVNSVGGSFGEVSLSR